ncbi:MAG TPA: cytidyltransferase [Bacteroidota bacterium]|jgi:regulator of RNase E activity RraA/CMP-N-acetylneuraminic acid synthetase|nr:cytidyltransferase [Bacteroidota bacterium]
MKVTAFLPAKGTSNRIPNKNTMLLDGEPMFLRSLKKLIQSTLINEVFLDTESLEIIEIASEVKCNILRRDPLLASNTTDGHMLFYNEVLQTDADICVQLLCTSPFIKLETIERGINFLQQNSEYDSVVAVRKEKQYRWQGSHPEYPIEHIPNSSDLPDTIIESMGLYVVRREVALKLKRRIGEHPYLLEIEPIESIDVNWPKDFELANLIAIGLREKERRLFNNIRLLLSSSLLSDILDDFGIEGVLSHDFKLNIPEAKIFGRAKTMQIEACTDDDDYKKIYESLNLYDHIVSNDIIVVANYSPEYAFFGELNANLAIRSGAVGAIIDGVTRDTHETQIIGFPVFAKGNYCKDTKKRGIVTAKNRTIIIDGISIHKDDLIFGDCDGIVVIPRNREKEILEEAMKKMKNERQILIDIAQGIETDELVQRYGFF